MRIITDSAADFTTEELEHYGVRCVRTEVMLNGRAYSVGEDMTEEEFWQRVLEGATVKTSQPSPEAFLKDFEAAKEVGEDVLCINISSALSGTIQSARIAAGQAEYDRIHIVDSMTGAAAQKLMVIYACRLRDEGRLLVEDIAQKLEAIRQRIRLYASLDTLECLGSSGRIPKAVASIGSLARLKPLLTVSREGKIVLCGKAFGRPRAIDALAEKIVSLRIDEAFPVIPLFSYDQKNCGALVQKLCALGVKVNEQLLSAIGPAIAGHIGPNAYGVTFVEAEA